MHPITQRNPMKKSFKTDAVTLDVTLPVTPKPLTNPKKFRIFAS